MTLGFNTKGNLQTQYRTTKSVSLGKLRNTIASTTRKYKFCNRSSPDLNFTFKCVFNGTTTPIIKNPDIYFKTYHILNAYIPDEGNSSSPDITNQDVINNDVINDDVINEGFKNKNFINPYATNPISSGPYNPSQIKSVYSIPTIQPKNGARNAIITIIAAYKNPYLESDIAKFGKLYGLPPCNLKIYNFAKKFNSSWAVEVTIDVQWAYAINPYAQIRVILAASNSSNDMFNAISFANNKNNFSPAISTDVINMSWGTSDTGNFSSYNNNFNNSSTIYIASSGDTPDVSFPSSCTNVIAAGGTSLKINTNNSTRNSETVWSNSGCGYSKSFSKPSYQPLINNINSRMTADISCVADSNTPVFVLLNGKLYSVGGTSISAPIYAGMISLIQQDRLNNKKATFTSVSNQINSIQPILYNSNYYSCFYDVTVGSSGRNSATTGYDIPSGLGVINLNSLISKLN